MLEMRSVTSEKNPAEYQLIHKAAPRWTIAQEYSIRMTDTQLLGQIGDSDAVAVLRRLAASDPEHAADINHEIHYYVREVLKESWIDCETNPHSKCPVYRRRGLHGEGHVRFLPILLFSVRSPTIRTELGNRGHVRMGDNTPRLRQ